LNPAYLRINIVAPEFKVEGGAEKKIEIVREQFSDLVSFQLTPQVPGEQRIMVRVYDDHGVSVGELPVETRVNDKKEPIVREANIVVLDLNVLVLVEPSTAQGRAIEAPAPMRKPPRKSSATRMGILSALSLLIVAGTTWMFVQQKSGPRPTDMKPTPRPQPPAAARPSAPSPPKRFVNRLGMEFVLIPKGSFAMGSNSGRASEKPLHHVAIARPFYLQTTEVSQGQWKKVMGNNPASFRECGDDCPVEQVSWDDANEFISRLNVMERTDKYRLPTEVEWEYACRAGMASEFSFGDDAGNLDEYAWYDENSKEATHRAATKKPNPWGLYDMHGNVWEWVEDDWRDGYDGPGAGAQPRVAKPRGSRRVIRGGSWESADFDCRPAARFGEKPDNRSFSLGFRLAKSVDMAP
jgi:formylglycine-generating enzyme required for sulfatase activity